MAIVGIISSIILPAAISKFNEKVLDLGYEREIKTISSVVDSLVVSENKKDFFSTMMYTDVEPESYEDTSGKFLKKYLRVAKYCGDTNGDCFASKYYDYSDNGKKEFLPIYKGSCARLKNGMSICITPQIGAAGVEGLIDLNGSKGPNILGRDLRSFTLGVKTRTGRVKDSTEVLVHNNGYFKLSEDQESGGEGDEEENYDPCVIEGWNSYYCCLQPHRYNSITSGEDPCCSYTDTYASHYICPHYTTVVIEYFCHKYPNSYYGNCTLQQNTSSGDYTGQIDVKNDSNCTGGPSNCHYYMGVRIYYGGKIVGSVYYDNTNKLEEIKKSVTFRCTNGVCNVSER